MDLMPGIISLQTPTLPNMRNQLQHYLNRFVDPPEEWLKGATRAAGTSSTINTLAPLDCSSYAELLECWKKALVGWTYFLDTTLSSMLAVVTSTKLQGDQLWLRVIGIPGTAKTTFCAAIGSNKEYCKEISKLTGLHSGYDDGSGRDFSLMDRLNLKTAILNEGDVLLTASGKEAIMAELRDIYSGYTNSDHRNREAQSYEGLRIAFILSGTPKIRALNKSALGDRFLDCVIYQKEDDVKESNLVRSVLKSNRLRSVSESDGKPESFDSPEKIMAKQKTAGYVTWLRTKGGARLLQMMQNTPEEHLDRVEADCEMLGRLTAYMRARAGDDDEEPTEKELHIRLSEQLRKAAFCSAVTLNQPTVTEEVMRRTAKLAHDTCYGTTFDISKKLMNSPLSVDQLAATLRKDKKIIRKSMDVLYELQAAKYSRPQSDSGAINSGRATWYLDPVRTMPLMKRLFVLLEGETTKYSSHSVMSKLLELDGEEIEKQGVE
jgi:hypothetical protein